MASPVAYLVRRGHLRTRYLVLISLALGGCRSRAPAASSPQPPAKQAVSRAAAGAARTAGVAIRIPTKGGAPRVYRLPTMVEVPTAIRGKLPPVTRVIGLDIEAEFLYVTTPTKDTTKTKKGARVKKDTSTATPKSDVLALDLGSARVDTVASGIEQAALGPDGTLYTIWDAREGIMMAVSNDGGVSFSRPMPVAAVNDIPSPLPGSSFRDNSFPSADVNQTTGAIYLVWADEEGSPPTALIKFTESDNGGTTWSTPITVGGRAGSFNAFFPSVAASPDGTNVFIAWPAQTWQANGTPAGAAVVSQFAAFQVRSHGTWQGAKLLSTASGDPDGSSTNSLGAQFLGDYATAVANSADGQMKARPS